jgi:tight adherence protein B
VTPLVLALCAGAGTALLIGFGRSGTPGRSAVGPRDRLRGWLAETGLAEVRPLEFTVVLAGVAATGGLAGFVLFGGALPAGAGAGFAVAALLSGHRQRRRRRREIAQDHWPQLLEEMRVLISASGRSVPQAVFDVGRRAPAELRPAFAAAQRSWLLGGDLDRALGVLKEQLADPTADVVCETLLVAHQVGGADVDRRLAALAEDRLADAQARHDARSRQAGARFARQFVLLVPVGMALAGMSVGNGRAAYATPIGQVLAVSGIALVVLCWLWAGRILRLPPERRVFPR